MTSDLKIHWAAYAAALWSVSFTLLHVAWAAGWYVGLNAQEAERAFRQTWFLVYDFIAAALCAVAAVVAVKLAQPKKNLTSRSLKFLAWSGTAVLALRGAAGIVKIGYLAFDGRNIFERMQLWEIWFCLGAIFFALATRRFEKADF